MSDDGNNAGNIDGDIGDKAVARDHFSHLAQQWSHFGPPLRPSPDDSAIMQQAVSTLTARAPRVAVLGLTPEIIACDWPPGTRLHAVDHSTAMMRALWPPVAGPADAQAILASWCRMPFAAGSLDMVAGDGGYIVFSYPQGYAELTREVRRVLRPGGCYAMRVFLRPDTPEPLPDIARDFTLGEIGSVHALKLRLLAALHAASGPGTLLDEVWRAWRALPPLPSCLQGRRGWTTEEIAGIEGYRSLQARYFLPTLAEMRAIADGFAEVACNQGSHELAARCPTLVWART